MDDDKKSDTRCRTFYLMCFQLIINTRQRTIKQKIIPLKDLNPVLNNYRNNLMSKWRYF